MKKPRQNAHDRFFKAAMNHKPLAIAFLERHLPENIKSQIDLSQLKIEDSSFIDENLRSFFSDKLFSAPGQDGICLFYVLVEHKSTPDPFVALQVRHYQTQILHDWAKQNPKAKKLPLVCPLIYYHGRRPFKYPTDLKKLINGPEELIKENMEGAIRLADISHTDLEKMEGSAWIRLFDQIAKHIYDPDIFPVVLDNIPELKEINDIEGSRAFIMLIFQYLFTQGQTEATPEELAALLENNLDEETREEIMTFAEKLEKIGLEKGKEEALFDVARNLLNNGCESRFVVKNTGLSLEQIKELQKEIERQK